MTETTDSMREYARNLFDRADDEPTVVDDDAPPEPRNVVRAEGTNVPPPRDEMRDFTRRLFDRSNY